MSPVCENCGEHVSAAYARVLGTNDGTVLECWSCRPGAWIATPAALGGAGGWRQHG